MFPTTRWTLIQQAHVPEDAGARRAMEELCQQYARPVYAFIRRRVNSAEQAEDATQEFFARLLDGTLLRRADPERGRFRTFLLHAVRNFLSDQHDYNHAQRRGGGVPHVSLDAQLQTDVRFDVTPEQLFDLQWIRALLQAAMDDLQQEYHATGKGELFDRLRGTIDDGQQLLAADIGRQLRMTEAAVRVALHRMRKRLGRIIRTHILDSVQSVDDVDDELNKLMQLLETTR